MYITTKFHSYNPALRKIKFKVASDTSDTGPDLHRDSGVIWKKVLVELGITCIA